MSEKTPSTQSNEPLFADSYDAHTAEQDAAKYKAFHVNAIDNRVARGDMSVEEARIAYGELIAKDKTLSGDNSYEDVLGDVDKLTGSYDENGKQVVKQELTGTSIYVEKSMPELAALAKEARKNDDKSTENEVYDHIARTLQARVDVGEMTEDQAVLRLEQIDRMIEAPQVDSDQIKIKNVLDPKLSKEDFGPAKISDPSEQYAYAQKPNHLLVSDDERRQAVLDQERAKKEEAENRQAEQQRQQAEQLEDARKQLTEQQRQQEERQRQLIEQQRQLAEQQRQQAEQQRILDQAEEDRKLRAAADEAERNQAEKRQRQTSPGEQGEKTQDDNSEAIKRLVEEERKRKAASPSTISLKGLATYISNVRRKKRAGFGSKSESAAAPASDEEPAVTGKKKSRIGKLLGGLKASPKETSAKTSDEQENTTPIASPPIGSVEPQWNGSRQQSPRERQVAPFANFNGSEAGSPADNPTVVIPRSGASRDNQDYPGNEAPTGPIAQTTRY